ncbi:hypothetical protein K2173_026781 [Erythroxylum novogranatense]|uniref:Uncharacterized protein n=1 Tax=Erythroxylum novogranatense TaxID=1862640 RepID=A0AAV8TZX3_9ROSI|nr:hypothetical protein K2173_026781 [Erythroxylum novogranatense]
MPRILASNLEKSIKPKFKLFQDSGLDPTHIVEIVCATPTILTRSVDNRLGPSILELKSVLGSFAAVSKVLRISRWVLNHDLKRTMMPNVEFLKSCGVSSSQIVNSLFNFPHFFLTKPETLRDYAEKIEDMGLDRQSRMFIHAIRVKCSMTRETWELKLKLLRNMGFTEEDILTVFRRAPQVFAVSRTKILASVQFFLSAQDLGISFVVKHPELLTFSVERRVKTRFEVIKVLKTKNLLPGKPGLATICKMTQKQFVDKYVNPYSFQLGLVIQNQ